MSVNFQGGVIELVGACPAQDAEELAALLTRQRSSLVDAALCVSLHGAVVQALLAFKPKIMKLPEDPILAAIISQVTGAIE